jgi:hypothetical protein
MRSALTRDLASWEQGMLSAAELELRHPDRAAGLVALYERLSHLGDGPVPDAEAGWDRLRELLPEHPGVVRVPARRNRFLNRRLVSRPLALAASLVLLGVTAYAVAPEAANRQLASFWESVTDLFGDDPSENGPARLEVEQLGAGPSDSVKDERDLGGHRSGDDADRREGDVSERRGSSEGSSGGSDTDGGSDDDSGATSYISGGGTDASGSNSGDPDRDSGGSDDGSRGSSGGSDRGSGGSGDSDGSGTGDDDSGDDGGGGDGDDGDDGDDDGLGGDDGGDG